LLQMRSSLPVRPSTARAKAAMSSTANLEGGGLLGTAQASRPSTAPATAGMFPASPSAAAGAGGEDEEELDDDDVEQDSATVLAEASEVIDELQRGWAEEHRLEVERLWRQLEKDYGLPPGEIPDVLALGSHGAPEYPGVASSAHVEDDTPFVVSAAEAAAGPEAGSARIPSTAMLDMEQSTRVVDAAAQQLEAVRRLRQALEHRPSSEAAAVPQSPAAVRAGEEDSERLGALRREVERLKTRQCSEPAPPTSCPGNPAPVAGSAPSTAMDFTALNQWIEDVKLISEGVANDCRHPSSPSRLHCSRGTPKSRKAMAQIAEERAIAAMSGTGKGSLPVSPSTRKGHKPAVQDDGDQRPMAAAPAPAAGKPGAATSPSGGAGREQAAMEQQLDDILGELDEIDRIHAGICKLTQPC